MKLMRAKSKKREGAAAVELAILLPLLILFLVGVWEVGRMVEVQQMLTNASREGGRQVSTGVRSVAQVKTSVANYLNRLGLTSVTSSDVTVTNITDNTRNDPMTCNQLDQWRVTVTIPFNSVQWVIVNKVVTGTQTLTASSDWYSMKDIPITVSQTIPLN